MESKNLKKLSRKELLEILVLQSKEIDELKAKLKETEDKLKENEIILDNVGSIAEASLKLTHIFEEADKAAQLYVKNVQKAVIRKITNKVEEYNNNSKE